jgi:DNA-binding NarL/FixJ family response regulator
MAKALLARVICNRLSARELERGVRAPVRRRDDAGLKATSHPQRRGDTSIRGAVRFIPDPGLPGKVSGAATAAPLRVIVCDNQPIVREGVAQILRDAGFAVVATADDASELVRKARAHRPDVVVTDVRLRSDDTDDGLRAAKTIRREMSTTGVLVLSQSIETEHALELVGDCAHGVGYLLKHHVGDLTTLTDAVRQVASGRSALDPDVVEHLAWHQREDDLLSRLTTKEREVLALMAEGLSNHGIADELVVSVAAVERHITSIFSKLDLHGAPDRHHRRVLAVLRYLRGTPD